MKDFNKGFTLIELLVVICIIGLILTIATPMYSDYKKRGYLATMKSDLNIIRTAQELYHTENDSYLAVKELKDELNNYGLRGLSKGNAAEISVTDGNYTVTITSDKTSSKVVYSNKDGVIEIQ